MPTWISPHPCPEQHTWTEDSPVSEHPLNRLSSPSVYILQTSPNMGNYMPSTSGHKKTSLSMRNRQRLCHGEHPRCSKEYDSVKSLTRHENTNLQTWKPNANIVAGSPHARIHSNDMNEVLGRSRGRFWIIGIVLALLPMYSKAAFAAAVAGGMNARWELRGDLIEIKYPLITYGKRACGDYCEECDHIPHEDLLGRLLLADLLAVKHGAISEKGFWSVSLTSSAGIASTLGLLVQLRNPMCWRDELNMWTFWRVAAYLEVLSKIS